MSPRGVAIPDLGEQLFLAAERVLHRAGPHGLTGRAITREAGCAAGLLNVHFGDLNAFLARFVVREFEQRARTLADLLTPAGKGEVADNMRRAGVSLARPGSVQVAQLVGSRPELGPLVNEYLSVHGAGLEAITDQVATYLDQEVEIGRLKPDTDTFAIALSLVGAAHHLVTVGADVPDAEREELLARLASALLRGVVT